MVIQETVEYLAYYQVVQDSNPGLAFIFAQKKKTEMRGNIYRILIFNNLASDAIVLIEIFSRKKF